MAHTLVGWMETKLDDISAVVMDGVLVVWMAKTLASKAVGEIA